MCCLCCQLAWQLIVQCLHTCTFISPTDEYSVTQYASASILVEDVFCNNRNVIIIHCAIR